MDCNIRSALLAVTAACMLSLTACAGPLTRWMVDLRNAQGDAALTTSTGIAEAQKEYQLALALDPHNVHARAGLAKALYLTAKQDFASSKLDDADTGVALALKYGPDDAATLALRSEIEQAKIRREIVVANYPLYGSIHAALKPVFKQIVATNAEIEKQVMAFSNDFDTAHLTRAIVESYDLADEAHRTASRLSTYRGLVQSGQAKSATAPSAEAPSLLPIP